MFGRLLPTFQQATNNLRQLHHVCPALRNLSASAKARSAQIQTPVGSTRYSSPTLVSSLAKHALSVPSRRVHISVEYTDEALRIARRLSGKVGVLAGLFGSLVGVGGGVLIVPMITGAAKVPQRLVSGSSLAAVISTGSVSALTYSDYGHVDYKAAAVLSLAAMCFAPAGARLTTTLNCATLRKTLGYFLLFAAPLIPLKAYLLALYPDSESPFASNEYVQTALLVVTGSVAGLASGLLGIGGGTIVTPMLALFMPLSQAAIVGTSLLAMIPPSLVGLAQHYKLGNVDVRMAGLLAVGTAVGSFTGSNLAVRAPDGVLEAAFSIGMAALGLRTLRSLR